MARIFRLINRFNLGGPSYNAAYLSKYLEPEFETLLAGGIPLDDEAHSGFIMDKTGVKYLEIPSMTRSVNPLSDLVAYRNISRLMADFKPDIVHTHAAKSGFLGRWSAWRQHVPVIIHTFHGHVFDSYFNNVKSSIIKSTERFMASKSDAIIAISPGQKNDLVEKHAICPASKVHVIPLGLDLDKFAERKDEKRKTFRDQYHVADDEFCLGIIGRFAPVKNHSLFFESIRDLKHFHKKKFKAFVIGDGDLREHFENQVRSFHLEEEVIFTSWINNIDLPLSALDLVVLTSRNEGTPVSLIEAQAAGVPIVTTNAGGVRDCMVDGKTGLVVNDMNCIAISVAIKNLIDNREQRKLFGENGQAFVRDAFSYKRLVTDMRSLYIELMQQKKVNFH